MDNVIAVTGRWYNFRFSNTFGTTTVWNWRPIKVLSLKTCNPCRLTHCKNQRSHQQTVPKRYLTCLQLMVHFFNITRHITFSAAFLVYFSHPAYDWPTMRNLEHYLLIPNVTFGSCHCVHIRKLSDISNV